MEPKFPSLPFITREMLRFGHKSKLQLKVIVAGDSALKQALTVVTRHGVSRFPVSTTADGLQATATFGIDDIPIFMALISDETSNKSAEIYGSVTLLIDGNVIATLMSGAYNSVSGLSWPYSHQEKQIPGRGLITNVNSANPAAGAEASITVPDGEMWRLLAGSVQFVTDANVANRRTRWDFTDASGVLLCTFSPLDQPASTTINFSLAQNAELIGSVGYPYNMVPLPSEIWLTPESTIETATSNIQAGDDYGIMRFMVEKYFGRA